MIDWDALIPAVAGQKTAETGARCPIVSHEKRPVSHAERDRTNQVTARLSDEFLPSVPVVPLKKHGRGKQERETGRAKFMLLTVATGSHSRLALPHKPE